MQRVDINISLKFAFALGASLTLAGCADTVRRSDFISDHIGDAVAANKAIHIVNPWPRESFETQLPGDGGRASAPVVRYRNGEQAAAPGGAAPVRTN